MGTTQKSGEALTNCKEVCAICNILYVMKLHMIKITNGDQFYCIRISQI